MVYCSCNSLSYYCLIYGLQKSSLMLGHGFSEWRISYVRRNWQCIYQLMVDELHVINRQQNLV